MSRTAASKKNSSALETDDTFAYGVSIITPTQVCMEMQPSTATTLLNTLRRGKRPQHGECLKFSVGSLCKSPHGIWLVLDAAELKELIEKLEELIESE